MTEPLFLYGVYAIHVRPLELQGARWDAEYEIRHRDHPVELGALWRRGRARVLGRRERPILHPGHGLRAAALPVGEGDGVPGGLAALGRAVARASALRVGGADEDPLAQTVAAGGRLAGQAIRAVDALMAELAALPSP